MGYLVAFMAGTVYSLVVVAGVWAVGSGFIG